MKRILFPLFIIAVVLVVGLPNHTGHADTIESVAFLKVESGTVELNREDTSIWVPVLVESVVAHGDSVRTAIGGRAVLDFVGSDAIIMLNPNTETYIDHISRIDDVHDIAVELRTGTISADFTESPTGESRYEIITPHAYFIVDDGVLDVNVNAAGDTVAMSEVGTTHAFDAGLVFEIPANHGIRIDQDGTPSEVLQVDSFAQMNTLVDGVPFALRTDADVQFNVRRGPDRSNALITTLMPEDITRVHGVSEDGNWYRIELDTRWGWIATNGLDVAVDSAPLLVYPATHVEEETVQVRETERAVAHDLPTSFTRAELSMVAAINQYRSRNGLQPMQPSDDLHTIALQQANYLNSLGSFPDDVHRDASGGYWRDRARAIGWPSYANDQQMNVGENIYIGASEQAAMTWWKNSDIHNRTILNPGYREIGVAAVPGTSIGTIYVVTFGSRPGVLPAMVDPIAQELVLTSELYTYSHIGEWIKEVQAYQILDAADAVPAEDGWQAYASRVALPSAEALFWVALRDAEHQIVVEVDPLADFVWIPEDLNIFTEVADDSLAR